MKDLGSLIGSMMVSLLRARRMADEETAKLAEIYKANPLLEGLSIPRIRIPELTIDIPMLIEGDEAGEDALMADKQTILDDALMQIDSTTSKEGITLGPQFKAEFEASMDKHVSKIQSTDAPVFRESVSRAVDNALLEAQKVTGLNLSEHEKRVLASDLRLASYNSSITRESTAPTILSNIKTADVKDGASKENVVRLKVTFKEEGLEWATSASDSGGVNQTLQPE